MVYINLVSVLFINVIQWSGIYERVSGLKYIFGDKILRKLGEKVWRVPIPKC